MDAFILIAGGFAGTYAAFAVWFRLNAARKVERNHHYIAPSHNRNRNGGPFA